MRPNILLAVVMFALPLTRATAQSSDAPANTPPDKVLGALAGMAAFSHKTPYSADIADLYLGYDASGAPRVAVALRSFKTYEKVTAMAVVRQTNGAWVIDKADIPDISAIRQPDKRKRASEALGRITGKTVKDRDGKPVTVDAVTGATRYHASIYESFNLLARSAVDELTRNPDWPRHPLPHP